MSYNPNTHIVRAHDNSHIERAGYDWFEPPPNVRDEIEREEDRRRMKKEINPITPAEAEKLRPRDIPAKVIEAFNECIVKHYKARDKISDFTQNEVVRRIRKKMGKKANGDAIWDNGWLDVEPLFEKAGWTIKYLKPDWGEEGETWFSFKKKP